MAGEFLSEAQAASYGRFVGPLGAAALERVFFLDDADREVVARHRGDRNRLGFGLQLGTVRALGTFLVDALGDVPVEAVDYVEGQVGVADPSCVKAYAEREKTRLEHQWEIAREYGFIDFPSGQADLGRWIDDRAWTTGEGPRALFDGAVSWLRRERVLLPGIIVLAMAAQVREAAAERLYDTVVAVVTAEQERALVATLEVPEGSRASVLDAWGRGPRSAPGKSMIAALSRVEQIAGLGMRQLDLRMVPARRLVQLDRYVPGQILNQKQSETLATELFGALLR